MAGPLQPITGYDPSAHAGGFHALHPLVNALLNVATLGEHSHPGSLGDYGLDVARSFDPRTRAGAVNLAGILVPGRGRGGRPTAEQANLLRTIHSETFAPGKFDANNPSWGSERKVTNQMGTFNVWNPNDPATAALAAAIGGPARGPAQRVYEGQQTAMSPLTQLMAGKSGGMAWGAGSRLGLLADRSRLTGYGARTPTRSAMFLDQHLGDLAAHQDWLNQLMTKNAIQRRN